MKLLILICLSCHEVVALTQDESLRRIGECPTCGQNHWRWMTQIEGGSLSECQQIFQAKSGYSKPALLRQSFSARVV